MMECLNCGYQNPQKAKYCQNCGQPLERKCANCGTVNAPTARFCMNCGSKLDPSAARATSPGSQAEITGRPDSRLQRLAMATPLALAEKIRAAAHFGGERRVVTVLFADVVGSTALAESMDPEDWTSIMNRAFDLITPAIYRYEGTIARLMGDALLVFFGAPLAHEDDPERAVRAALDMLAVVRQYAQEVKQVVGIDFAMRIGLNTGLVVVGEVGSDLVYEYTAMGDAVNLAARLQAAAKPMSILLAESTYRFIPQAFDYRDLGDISVKGKTEQVHIYEVTGAKPRIARSRGLKGLQSQMIGRESELAALKQLDQMVKAGIGRIVLVIGEAGVGKSRLIAEWKSIAQKGSKNGNFRWGEGRCLSYGQGFAYHLLADLLRSLLDISTGSSEPGVQAALSELCVDLFGEDNQEVYPFLGHLLALPMDGQAGERVRGLDPQSLQTGYLAALRQLLQALAARQPLVLVLDDIHWADPSSIELLGKLFPLALEAPILFCCLARPERDSPGWKLVTTARELLGPALTEIDLRNLSKDDSTRLVANLLEFEELPPGLNEMILSKAEGNPLFVEEVIRMLVDRGYLVQNGRNWIFRQEVKEGDIPENLHGLLLERIDRLPDDVKRTLRVAAVVGRQFSVRVLEKVLRSESIFLALTSQLQTLEGSGLISLARVTPEVEYTFRHALVHEAAYHSLLKNDKREIHRIVGEVLEQGDGGKAESLAAEMAYHFYQAEDIPQALKYYQIAGDFALSQYAVPEALSHYTLALELSERANSSHSELYRARGSLYETLGDFDSALADLLKALSLARRSTNRQSELQTLLDLGMLWASRDYAQTGEYFQKALELARSLGDSRSLAHSLNRVGNWYLNIDQPYQAVDYHSEALAIFESLEDQGGIAETLDLLGMSTGIGGDAFLAERYFRRAIALFRELDDRKGLASSLSNLIFRGPLLESDVVLHSSNHLSDTLGSCEEAIEIARSIYWRPGEAYGFLTLSQNLEAMGEYNRAFTAVRQGLQIAREINHRQWLTFGTSILGVIYMNVYALDIGLEHLQEAYQLGHTIGSVNFMRIGAAFLARVYLLRGDPDSAESYLDQALDLDAPAETLGQRLVWTSRAQLALNRGNPGLALEILDRLVEGLRNQAPGRASTRLSIIRGEALAALGEWDRAETELQLGCRVAEKQGIRPLLAPCLALLGRVHRHLGRKMEAKKEIAAAQTILNEMAVQLEDEDLRSAYLDQAATRLFGNNPTG
jgi:class 3 adenylate cyclase/tetratricopeptide (TPR) repeat protein